MSTTPSRRAARQPAAPPTAEVAPAQEPTLGELVANLSRDMTTLVRQELELARTEIKEELGRTSRAGGMLGGTALAGYLAVLMVSFAVVWGLAEVMPTGLAFLIVGIAYAVAGYFLFQRGRQELKQVRPVPEQTIETLKEDAEWARQQMR